MATAVAALLAWTFSGVSWGAVGTALAGIGPAAPLLLAPSVLAVAAETSSLARALAVMGHTPALGPLFAVRAATESLALGVPLGALAADAAKPPLLERFAGVPFRVGIALVVVRKYSLVASQGALLVMVSMAGHGALARGIDAIGAPRELAFTPAAAGCLLLAAAEFLALGARGTRFAHGLLGSLALLPGASLLLAQRGVDESGTAAALHSFFRGSIARRAVVAAPALLGWIFEGFETWCFVAALGAPLEIADAVAIEATVVLARHVLVALPAGLGAQEAGYALLLGASGVPLEAALAFSLLKRMTEVVWIVAGAAGLAAMRRRADVAPRIGSSAAPLLGRAPAPAPGAA